MSELACVQFSLSSGRPPWDYPEAFLSEIECTIVASLSDQERKVGRIELLWLHAAEAINQGFRLREVCDAHSDLLYETCCAVLTKDEDVRPALDLEAGWHNLLFIWEFEIEPEFRDILADAVQSAIFTFGEQSLILAAQNRDDARFIGIDLTVDEWRKLGFVKIAKTQFVVCDRCSKNPYRSE